MSTIELSEEVNIIMPGNNQYMEIRTTLPNKMDKNLLY
jgi:hypothetical protein